MTAHGRTLAALVVSTACSVSACGSPGIASGGPETGALAAPPAGSSIPSPAHAPPSSTAPSGPPDAAALFRLLQADLVTCYELGKQATPEMADGKLTLNASIDATGTPLCVIPSDHTGLTQEVEDCMSARFAAQKLPAGAPWSASVPVLIRGGAVQPGERASDAVLIESVETFRMPDAFDTLEALEPALQACMQNLAPGGGVKRLLVGARVGADGRPQCALATSRGALPANVTDCAAGVLRGAKFPPPKRGAGLVLVPIAFAGSR